MPLKTITKPKVEIASDILEKLKEQFEYEGQVIIHIHFVNTSVWEVAIRIWPTTFLYDQDSEHKSNLLNAYNITNYPEWKMISGNTSVIFTLIFSKLPHDCLNFDMIEHCSPELGGFTLKSIERNESDVYFLKML